MPSEAFAVHGLSDDFLVDKPLFEDEAEELLTFLGDSPLVIHNARFDVGFLNAEFQRLGHPNIPLERAIDTVALARQKFPGAPANLDALCRRFQIDLSDRSLHGALKDSRLLAEVYLELRGGRQPGLELVSAKRLLPSHQQVVDHKPLIIAPTPEEEAAHKAFVARLSDPIWPQS